MYLTLCVKFHLLLSVEKTDQSSKQASKREEVIRKRGGNKDMKRMTLPVFLLGLGAFVYTVLVLLSSAAFAAEEKWASL